MKLRFTKMTGLGNDFVMLDGISQRLMLTPERIRALADRHFGIGCDQVLVVEPPPTPQADFAYRIYNSDGGEVENCGNGARCFALFVRQRRLTGRRQIRVETRGGPLTLEVLDDNRVRVNMGQPRFDPAQIPFLADAAAPFYSVDVAGAALEIMAVSFGNPHAVTRVEDVGRCELERLGPLLEAHPMFPERANAGFVQVVDRQQLRLRVFERGAGETLACGTGACAAAVTAMRRGWADPKVAVHLPGGRLDIAWRGEGHDVIMTGPAKTVYHGQISL